MKNRFAILITLGALLMVLIAQPACESLGASKPPHHGAFLKKGRSFVEMEQHGLERPLPSDEGVPHTSDKQPLIVVWDPDVIPRFLVLSGGKFDMTSKEDGVLELRPREPLSPGMYCLSAGHPLLPPPAIPHWYFVVEGTAAEAEATRQAVKATAEFLAPTATAEAISVRATADAEATRQAALTIYDPPKPGLYAVNQLWQGWYWPPGSPPYLVWIETVEVLDERTMRLHLSFSSNGKTGYISMEDSKIIFEDGTVLGMLDSGGELANIDRPGDNIRGFADFPIVRNSEMVWTFWYEYPYAHIKAEAPELRFKDFTPVESMPQATEVAIAAENAKVTATAEAIAAERAAVTATREAWEASVIGSYPVNLIAPETNVSGPNTHMELTKIEVSNIGQMRLYLTIVVDEGSGARIMRPNDIYLWQGGQTYSAIAFEGFFEELREGLHELRFDGGEGTRVSGTITFPSVPDVNAPFEFHYGKYYTFVNISLNEELVQTYAEAVAAERASATATREAWEASVVGSYPVNLIAPETNVSGPNTHMELAKIEVSSIGQMRLYLTIVVEHGSGARIMQPKDIYLWQGGQTYSAIAWGGFFEGLRQLHIDGGEGTRVSGTISFPSVLDVNVPFEFHYGEYYTFVNISLNEDLIQTYLSEGQTYLDENDLEQAKEAYAKALELNPNIIQAHSALGYIYALQGKLQEALEENLKVLELAPNDYATHKNLAMIYQQLGRIEEAIAEAETALELAPESAKPELEALIVQLREQIGP